MPFRIAVEHRLDARQQCFAALGQVGHDRDLPGAGRTAATAHGVFRSHQHGQPVARREQRCRQRRVVGQRMAQEPQPVPLEVREEALGVADGGDRMHRPRGEIRERTDAAVADPARVVAGQPHAERALGTTSVPVADRDVHLLESSFLGPKIMGAQARMHPVLVIFALIAGANTYGVVGAVLAVPMASVIQTLFLYFRSRAWRIDAAASSLPVSPILPPR